MLPSELVRVGCDLQSKVAILDRQGAGGRALDDGRCKCSAAIEVDG
jgi:hypothetical protein